MKTRSMTTEYTELEGAAVSRAKKPLQWLFIWCVQFVKLKLGENRMVYVTSVHRAGPGVHRQGRGIDFAVEGMADPKVVRVLLTMKNLVNLMFPYTKADGSPGYTCVYKMRAGSGDDYEHVRHVHLQLPVKEHWNGTDAI